jgi:hypothetical protein
MPLDAPGPLPWPFAVLDRSHAALLTDAADRPWQDGQPVRARAWSDGGWIHLRRGRARLRLRAEETAPLPIEAAVRAAVGADARALWLALAEQAFQADGGRIFLHQPLPATTACGAAIVPIVSGDPVRWREARRRLRLPDFLAPHDLVPPPAWIHVAEGPSDSAHLRLRRRAALVAHGLDVLPPSDPR